MDKSARWLGGSTGKTLVCLGTIGVVVLMTNINALVDLVLHPDIPYFDAEHLIVGGVNGAVTTVGLVALAFYVRRLKRAHRMISSLEGVLPICANCKRIRRPSADPDDQRSWDQLEAYISSHTTSEFTHGLCPNCRDTLYGTPGPCRT